MKLFHCCVVFLAAFTSLSDLRLLQGRVVALRDTSSSVSTSTNRDLMRVNCGSRMREMCSTFVPAQNYSLKLSSVMYSPRQEIKAKVFMTHCPSISHPGPRWYQLEAVTNSDSPQPTSSPAIGSKSMGGFYAHRSQLHVCTHRTRVVFTSCDPKSFDLPNNYLWIAPNTPTGEICFRLTVQHGETDQSSCEEKIVCIQPTESESSGQESDDNISEAGSGNYDYSEYDNQFDASHTKPELPTLTDAQEEDDKDSEMDVQEISNSSYSPTATPMCESERQFFLSFNYGWIPRCDCHGYYEPVQCWVQGGQLECWCSTRTGLIIPNTRRRFNCINPEEFDFDCTGAS